MKEFINKWLEATVSLVKVFRIDVGADVEKFFIF